MTYLSAAVFRPAIFKVPHLSTFLPEVRAIQRFHRFHHYDSVIGWGVKHTAGRARRYAQRKGLPYIALEDGFIRSIGLGVRGSLPFSLVVDSQGIYYDARIPSDLEQLIATRPSLSPDQRQRAKRCRQRIVDHRFSKYNIRDCAHSPQSVYQSNPVVVVIDQTMGDASIAGSLSTPDHFHRMLDAAMDEHPHQQILVKVHPDVVAGKKKGYLYPLPYQDNRLTVDSQGGNPWHLLAVATDLYTVSSLMGFEALIAGINVTCFGMPFYAGWGLTRDHQLCIRRGKKRDLDTVFDCAYLNYARYVHPLTGLRCQLEDILTYLQVLLD